MVLVLSNHSVLLLSYQKRKALQSVIWGAFPLLYLGGISVKKQTKERMFSEYPDVVNVKQMCEMLGGICDKTAYKLLKSGKIKSFIVGRRYRIPKLNILEYLELIDKSTA